MAKKNESRCVCCLILSGCDARVVADFSNDPEHGALVGTRYEIMANIVAFGVEMDLKPLRTT